MALLAAVCGAASAHAAEHITLTNGFDLICDHRAVVDGHIRLYLDQAAPTSSRSAANQIAASESVKLPAAPEASPAPENICRPATDRIRADRSRTASAISPRRSRTRSGRRSARQRIREESGGHTRAVSRTGAQGLMQLMPGTAAELGVADAFAPGKISAAERRISTACSDRYHGNLAFALAAYNAGPGAVDRWHGIPPYRETQLYVARVIHEFNRRIAARSKAHGLTQVASAVR